MDLLGLRAPKASSSQLFRGARVQKGTPEASVASSSKDMDSVPYEETLSCCRFLLGLLIIILPQRSPKPYCNY